MDKSRRARYTHEFKLEALRMATWSYGCEDEFEVAYHARHRPVFSVTVTCEFETELDISTAECLLGGTQAFFE